MEKCWHDPKTRAGEPIGMYHCPGCGEMVVAGVEHFNYSGIEESLEDLDAGRVVPRSQRDDET